MAPRARSHAADAVESCLHTLGFPAREEDLDEESVTILAEGHGALVAALARRGWVFHFDAEGDFFEPDAHAFVVRNILMRAGFDSVEVADSDESGHGPSIEITLGKIKVRYVHEPDEFGEDDGSEWVDLELITGAVVGTLAGSGFVLVDLPTGDQTVMLAVIPEQAFEALKQSRLAKGAKRLKASRTIVRLDARGQQRARARRFEAALEILRDSAVPYRRTLVGHGIEEALLRESPEARAFLAEALEDDDRMVAQWALDRARLMLGDQSLDRDRASRALTSD